MILAILASLVLWPLYIAVALVLQLVGLVILVPLCLTRAWVHRDSRVYAADGTPRSLYPMALPYNVAAWRGGWLTWLWGNEEDGVYGPLWWQHRTGTYLSPSGGWRHKLRVAWSAYRWSALRNPANNMRFIPWINPAIVPAHIQHIPVWTWPATSPSYGSSLGWFCWQGVYSGLCLFPVIRGQQFRLWIGWKLKPEDRRGVPDTDMRKPRCGFAMQFKRI